MKKIKCNHYATDEKGLCAKCGYNTLHLTNKELKNFMAKKTKYDNKSRLPSKWTTSNLKKEARGLNQLIHEIGCYGVRDMIRLETIFRELEKRGYEIEQTNILIFTKE